MNNSVAASSPPVQWISFRFLPLPWWLPFSSSAVPDAPPSNFIVRGIRATFTTGAVSFHVFMSCLIIFVVVNIAIRSLQQLPFSEAAHRELAKETTAADEIALKGHKGRTAHDIWKIIKLQLSICVAVTGGVLKNTTHKLYLFFYCISFFVLSKEFRELKEHLSSFHYLHRPSSRPDADSIISEKSILFMRHGESFWNFAFNRPLSIWLPFRVLYLLGWELVLGCERNSVVLDSPLSEFGQYQSSCVLKWLENEATATQDKSDAPTNLESGRHGQGDAIRQDILRWLSASNEEGRKKIVAVSSNLRRAISTALIAFNNRWSKTSAAAPNPPVYIHSCLQEATRNADGYALTAADFGSAQKARPVGIFDKNPLVVANRIVDLAGNYTTALDLAFDSGSKSWHKASLLQRLLQFADWVFDPNSPAAQADAVLAVGHSIWFRQFFVLFLPPKCKAEVTTKKLPNCSILRFQLIKYKTSTGRIDYWIDPASLVSIYDGGS